MSADYVERPLDSYNTVLLKGWEVIFQTLERRIELPVQRREQFVYALDNLAGIYKATTDGELRCPFNFFPTGPHPGLMTVCPSCESPYSYEDAMVDWTKSDRNSGIMLGGQNVITCCESASIPGMEQWLGLCRPSSLGFDD